MSPINRTGPNDPTGPLKPIKPKPPAAPKAPAAPAEPQAKVEGDKKALKKSKTAKLDLNTLDLNKVAMPGQTLVQALGLPRPASANGLRKVADTLAEATEGVKPTQAFLA